MYCSPERRKVTRLVTSTLTCGHASSKRPTDGAAWTTCSKLSNISSTYFACRNSLTCSKGATPPSGKSSPCAIATITWSGSRMVASWIKQTPLAKKLRSSAASWKLKRVLPMPPGPSSVRRRISGRISKTRISAISCSRPTSGVKTVGTFQIGPEVPVLPE